MALFNISLWQRSRFTLQWLIINLVGSLACLTAVALAQFEWSEGVSGSVSIPDVAFTCLGNLAVFMTAFTRGRLDVENGARDVLATTRGPKLNAINGCGLTTRPPNDLRAVDVVLLSKYNERPHSSLTQFMQYVSHSHDLESILLQVHPLESAGVDAGRCKCIRSKCRCVVFRATKKIMMMLARQLPGTLKQLPESQQCLLPSLRCLKNRCHGCDQDLLHVKALRDVEAAGESPKRWTSLFLGNPRVDSPAAVCEALNKSLEEEESSCICIPVQTRNADRWTKFMIKFLKSKEKEAKGIKVVVSDALQHYITQNTQELRLLFQRQTGCIVGSEIYERASLILPRVAEVIVNMGLTGWLRVDGFSSSLVARRAIRDHVVDSAGTGFGANAFLNEAMVFCGADGTNVCQALFFRGGILSARRVSYMVGCVNLICSIAWSVLIACEGNWAPSMPLSTRRVSVIIGAVGVSLGMDCFEVYGGKVRPLSWAGAQARDEADVWAREMVALPALLKAKAKAEAQGQVEAAIQVPAGEGAEAQAQVEAAIQVQAGAGAEAEAEAQVQVEVPAGAGAEAEAQVEAAIQVSAGAGAEAEGQVEVPVQPLARTRSVVEVTVQPIEEVWSRLRYEGPLLDIYEAQAQAEAKARDWGWDRAWVWVLVAVVMLEVGCIASLVVRLSMKKGLGRWVYSGMQVLVWLKWGIGSFLLGDNATGDEDGSPYFQIRNRGTWVYCSAFLLNAMLAGVRRKWVYSI